MSVTDGYRWRHISSPHGERVPVDIVQEGGAMLAQAINELRR